jgi:hypothetical protein
MVQRRCIAKADLIVLIGLAMAGVPLLAQVTTRNSELSRRTFCASNLRAIGMACIVYGNDHQDRFPALPAGSATAYDVSMKPDAGETTPAQTFKGLYTDEKDRGNPAANLWLLVINQQVTPQVFICPGDPFANVPAEMREMTPNPSAGRIYRNFQDSTNLSYSMVFPWTQADPRPVGRRRVVPPSQVIVFKAWANYTDASLPNLSDMAPFLGNVEPATRPASQNDALPVWGVNNANSQNHLFRGQNVEFNDAHVDFATRPTVGHRGDSIWGINKDSDAIVPVAEQVPLEAGKLPHQIRGAQGAMDVVMVPTRDANGNLK